MQRGARRSGFLFKEENYARIAKKGVAAPLMSVAEHRSRVTLEQVWQTLPEVNRREALLTLSRIVAQQIFPPQDSKEVRHEDC